MLGDDGEIAVEAQWSRRVLRTEVRLDRPDTSLMIGHVLPADADVRRVFLDGDEVDWRIVTTARGRELVVDMTSGKHELVIRLR